MAVLAAVTVPIGLADLAAATSHQGQAEAGSRVTRGITFATYEDQGGTSSLELDLYVPDSATVQAVPVIVWVHGGGWFQGSKDNCPGATFAANGYAMACIDYRLGEPLGCPAEVTFPVQVQDVKAAIRWVRLNASQYHLDGSHVATMGDSSGGHLAALAGLSYSTSAFESDTNSGATDAVQAVVDWFGPIDVTRPPPTIVFTDDPCTTTWEALNQAYGGEETPYFYWTYAWGVFLGGGLADSAVLARAAQATPLAYVDSSDPPCLIIHGDADGMVPIEQSRLLETALTAAGVEAQLVTVTGGGHGFGGEGEEVGEAFLTPTLAFLDRVLGGGGESPSLTWVRTGGPPGGLGYDIRYSFDDPTRWYVTDTFGGVHVSTDNGRTWQPSNSGIPGQLGPTSEWRPVFSLTVDPHDPKTLWVGTDKTGHIYRSTDAGVTWEQRDTGVSIEYDVLSFRGFTVDPRSSDIVYAMAETQSYATQPEQVGGVVYVTRNGGQSWSKLWDGGMPSSLARYLWIDPAKPNVLYVSTGIFDRAAVNEDVGENPFGGLGVLKSEDGGQTWTELDEDNGFKLLYFGSLFMHPDDPATLLAAAGRLADRTARAAYLDTLEAPIAGVYRTSDGGDSWHQVIVPPMTRVGEAFSSVEFCVSDPDIAYAGSEYAVYRSEDGGQTWTTVAGGDSGWGPAGIHAGWPIDFQCDPNNPARLFANNYLGGNFLTEDGGRTWRNASDGYTGAQLIGVFAHPDRAARVYATGRSGVYRSDRAGRKWYGLRHLDADYPLLGREFGAVVGDPSNPDHIITGEASILETTDGGESWTHRWVLSPGTVDQIPSGIREPILSTVAFARSDPRVVYAGIAERDCMIGHEPCQLGIGVLRSDDGGQTWQQTSTGGIGHVGVIDLAVQNDNPLRVLAACETGLYDSPDGGSSWSPVSGLPAGKRVRAVTFDPQDETVILAAVDGIGIYRSNDGGRAWNPSYTGLEANGSLHDIVFDQGNPRIVYAADHLSGVYRSEDGGATWAKINSGLTMRTVTAMTITADGNHLYVATDGEGVFRLDVDGQPPPDAPAPRAPRALIGR